MPPLTNYFWAHLDGIQHVRHIDGRLLASIETRVRVINGLDSDGRDPARIGRKAAGGKNGSEACEKSG